MTPVSSSRPPTPTGPGRILFALAFAGLSASFMQTVLIPIQGRLPELLDAPLSITSWAITVTQLVSAVWMPIAGRLADMFGKRRVLLAMLVLLILGSVLAGLAGNIWVLLIARCLQGAGFGVVVTGISLLRDVMPPERLASSVGVVSATLGVGGALGMPLAAVVAEQFDWRALFWVAALISALAMAGVLAFVPASDVRTGGRVDWIGMLGLIVGTTAVLLLIANGATWNNPGLVLAILAGALLVFLLWGRHELRVHQPLVDLRVNARRSVMMTNLTGITMGFALFTPQVAFPQMLTLPTEFGGFALPLLGASLVVMPLGLSMLLVSPLAGRLERVWQTKYIVALGALLMGVGYIVIVLAPPVLWIFPAAAVIIGAGTGLGYAAMPALIMSSVPVSETGSANGVNALARSLGTALAAAIVGGILAASSVTKGGITAPVLESFDAVFLIAIGASLACATLAALIPPTKYLGDVAK